MSRVVMTPDSAAPDADSAAGGATELTRGRTQGGTDVHASVPLRVLFVDDSADDSELAEIELRHAGLPVDCRRVDREDALRTALEAFIPDVVLSDINMPGFSGQRAHALVTALAPQARFAFLTGAVEPAIAPLPASVPVLLKDTLSDLPALLRTLLGRDPVR